MLAGERRRRSGWARPVLERERRRRVRMRVESRGLDQGEKIKRIAEGCYEGSIALRV